MQRDVGAEAPGLKGASVSNCYVEIVAFTNALDGHCRLPTKLMSGLCTLCTPCVAALARRSEGRIVEESVGSK